jgi:hypothetical protein
MRVGTTDKEIKWLSIVTATGKASATRARRQTRSMPSQQYLIVFAQAHENFRVPELLSIAELYSFSLNIENNFDPSRPFGILVLEQEEHVRLLARRCILIK